MAPEDCSSDTCILSRKQQGFKVWLRYNGFHRFKVWFLLGTPESIHFGVFWLVVWNMNFMTFHRLGIIHLTHIFQRGRYTTNQWCFYWVSVRNVEKHPDIGSPSMVLGFTEGYWGSNCGASRSGNEVRVCKGWIYLYNISFLRAISTLQSGLLFELHPSKKNVSSNSSAIDTTETQNYSMYSVSCHLA